MLFLDKLDDRLTLGWMLGFFVVHDGFLQAYRELQASLRSSAALYLSCIIPHAGRDCDQDGDASVVALDA